MAISLFSTVAQLLKLNLTYKDAAKLSVFSRVAGSKLDINDDAYINNVAKPTSFISFCCYATDILEYFEYDSGEHSFYSWLNYLEGMSFTLRSLCVTHLRITNPDGVTLGMVEQAFKNRVMGDMLYHAAKAEWLASLNDEQLCVGVINFVEHLNINR